MCGVEGSIEAWINGVGFSLQPGLGPGLEVRAGVLSLGPPIQECLIMLPVRSWV